MARVRVEPSGIELEVPAGVTIMQAARDAGYYWPNQCDMQCRCSNCFFRVVEGAAALSAMGRAERATLREQRGRRALEQPVRLGLPDVGHGRRGDPQDRRVRRSVCLGRGAATSDRTHLGSTRLGA